MPPGDGSSRLGELTARVEELERRLTALEHSRPTQSPHAESPSAAAFAAPGAEVTASSDAQPNLLPLFGRAILGIAGAYLLRAAAESGMLAPWLAVALALAYAAGWLIWSARPDGHSRFAQYIYGFTGALILSAMLWEVTVRFRTLEPALTAALVAAFALLSMALAWRGDTSAVIWVGMLTAVCTAFVLLVATREPVPFTWAVVGMTAMAETAAWAGRWRVLRAIVVLATDMTVVVLLLLLGDASAVPEEYHAADPGVLIAIVGALFLIFAASTAVRTLGQGLRVTGFEIVQFAAAVLLTGWGVLRITHGAGALALGVLCLAAGATCYFTAFGLLGREGERWNFHFYAACGVVFAAAGSFFALSGPALVIWLCVAAVGATGLGVRMRNPILDVHGVVYLAGAAWASRLLGYGWSALAGSCPPAPGGLEMAAAATAVLTTVMVSRYRGEHTAERLLRLLPAILAVYAVAALAVTGIAGLVARGGVAELPALAVVRTVVTGAAALALAFAGARIAQRELVWMAYAAAVVGSLKLAVEDLRIGSTQSLAASLLIFGAVLILIPRLARAGKLRA